MVEHSLGKGEVTRSIRVMGTRRQADRDRWIGKSDGKGKFERTKPHVNVGTIGTWITADDADGAMTHILAKKYGGEAKNYDQIDAAPRNRRAASPSTPRM